jgi:hypothetical protein
MVGSRVLPTLLSQLALLLLLTGCGASATRQALATGDVRGALAAYQAEPARELDDLKAIAGMVLVAEARAADATRSARAWSMLRGMGKAADRAWAELERAPGDHHPELVRAHALAWRSQHGDASAWRELRAIADDAREAEAQGVDLEVLAVALETLDPERDVAALRAWAHSASSAVRGAAVEQLQSAPPSTDTRVVLVELARAEPDQALRAQAIRALAAQGASAWDSLESVARETEPKAGDACRAAALAALARLDIARAMPLLAAALSDAPSMLGVEVAQDVLVRAQHGQRADSLEATAEQQILAALAAPKPDLRGRAASAALAVTAGAERAALEAELLVRLRAERDRRVHVLLALALRGHPSSQQALQELSLGRDVPAAQAAAELAALRDAAAPPRLRELAKSKDANVRATAAGALASNYDFAASRGRPASLQALLDHDPRVRATTAGAVLRAIERLQNQL